MLKGWLLQRTWLRQKKRLVQPVFQTLETIFQMVRSHLPDFLHNTGICFRGIFSDTPRYINDEDPQMIRYILQRTPIRNGCIQTGGFACSSSVHQPIQGEPHPVELMKKITVKSINEQILFLKFYSVLVCATAVIHGTKRICNPTKLGKGAQIQQWTAAG